jgi:peptidoglycan/LPS O-acetylase OafA/YrhL
MNSQRNNPFDFLRTFAMLGVVLFHAAAAYSILVPYWSVHDTPGFMGDVLRELLDVYIMPFFLFISGYFVLPSLKKNTLATFIFQKFKRLYVYWIFIILIIIPFMWWKELHLSGNYFGYWLNYFLNIKNISIGPLPNFSHMHFWFVSLLFYVLIAFGIFYKLSRNFFNGHGDAGVKPYKEIGVLNLLTIGILSTLIYFISVLKFPESSWVNLPFILQFKTTHLLILVFYFGFGVYSGARGWFSQKDMPFNLTALLISSIVLTILFFIVGKDVFNNLDGSNTLSPAYLFIYSLIRSFLLLSYLITLWAIALKYFNRRFSLVGKIADVSYEIYLVHVFVIVGIQEGLKHFALMPVAVKICLIFAIGTIIGYFVAKYTIYKFPRISAAAMFVLFFVLMVIFNR